MLVSRFFIHTGLRAWILCLSSFFWVLPAQAQFKWEKREYERKLALGETNVVARFGFENVGQRKMSISQVQTSCDCTKAELTKKEYAPGEKGEIVVRFDASHRVGVQEKQVVVHSDGPTEKITVLKFKVIIPELLSIKPQLLLWKKGAALVAKTVSIKVVPDQSVQLTKIVSTIPEFSSDLKVIKPGLEYELKVTPASTEQTLTGRIQIETDFKTKSPLDLGVHLLVR